MPEDQSFQAPTEVISAWSARVLASPERAAELDAVYKFVVSGAGGGTWVFRCREPVSVTQGDGRADCTISATAEDFMALACRRMNPQFAFLQGRLKVTGDLALALRLHKVTGWIGES